jgi:N-acetylmuramoyl-L-alanine amidase
LAGAVKPCIALALAYSGLVQAAALSSVLSIRHWAFENATRIAIQTSDEAAYHVELLENPYRISIDLKDSILRMDGRKFVSIDLEDRLVRQIRAAQTQPSVTRVVLDLKGPVVYELSHLVNPDRLMVELKPRRGDASASVPPRDLSMDRATAAPVTLAATPPVAPPQIPRVADATSPRPAKRNSDGGRTLTRVLGLKLGRVVLDPGHGGHDQGTMGPTGFKEKDLVLDVAQRLGALLEARLGAKVVYTRSDDTFVPLGERTAIANRNEADLFLSIHANSSPAPTASGSEAYYLNFTNTKADLELAARENAGTEQSIFELQDLVRKIALQDKVDESREFAARIQSALYVSSRAGAVQRNRGVKKAPFVVLIGAKMPSVLAEIAFLSNPRDEAQTKRPDVRQKLAEALFRGISQYAATLSHFDLAQGGTTRVN